MARSLAALLLSLAAGTLALGDELAPLHKEVVRDIDGAEVPLERYRGKVLLIVNVASRCGYTGQYKGLEALYQRYREQGLVVLGFPCNQFMGQEPGSEAEIKRFCRERYSVSFPLFAKIRVKGSRQLPLYRLLTESKGQVSWNFNKFLIGRDGTILARFGSSDTPRGSQLVGALESALKAPPPAPLAAAAAQPVDLAAYLAPPVGTRLVYERRRGEAKDEVVLTWRAREGGYRVEGAGGRRDLLRSPEGLSLAAEAQGKDERRHDPPLPLLPGALTPGKELALGEGAHARVLFLEGREGLKTPAGVFAECLRVRIQIGRGPTRRVERVWLAKGVGEVKREAGKERWTLRAIRKPL